MLQRFVFPQRSPPQRSATSLASLSHPPGARESRAPTCEGPPSSTGNRIKGRQKPVDQKKAEPLPQARGRTLKHQDPNAKAPADSRDLLRQTGRVEPVQARERAVQARDQASQAHELAEGGRGQAVQAHDRAGHARELAGRGRGHEVEAREDDVDGGGRQPGSLQKGPRSTPGVPQGTGELVSEGKPSGELKPPELLAPVGGWPQLHAAVENVSGLPSAYQGGV